MNWNATILVGLVFLMISTSSAQSKEFIFESAPFASCHASTIVELRNGDLLAAWFGGRNEGAADVAILTSRHHAGHWSAPLVVAREAKTPTWNPVLFHTKDGRLWLYYKFGVGPRKWKAARIWSDDEGANWSAPERLPSDNYGPIRAKPLVLDDGTVVSGSSVEDDHSWNVWIERSSDNGKTWRKVGPITVPPGIAAAKHGAPNSDAPYGIIQPSIVSLGGSHLRLYARSSAHIGKICIADSLDNGSTWSQARPLDVPNPNSGIDAISLANGWIVLIFNDSSSERTPLNLAVSRDGEHFRIFSTLEDSPGEYSYPAMILGKGESLHMTYTWNRKRIRYASLAVSDIPQP
jgi:predicted neuraminidase